MNRSERFVDIHTHILPGVDDGSGSMDETIQMLHKAVEQGITTIIATPHYFAGRNNASVEHLNELKERVQSEAYKISKDLKILLGNELYYSDSIIESLKSQDALTLAGSNYVLVEFSINALYKLIYQGMNELIQAGFFPILAHVERYQCLKKREDFIGELIKLGCYIQMNSNSLIGSTFNSEAIYNRRLLKQGFVHFIGSDCHDNRIRVPSIMTAVKTLHKRKIDESLINKIVVQNPAKILENTYL